jgi:hypothetical protein
MRVPDGQVEEHSPLKRIIPVELEQEVQFEEDPMQVWHNVVLQAVQAPELKNVPVGQAVRHCPLFKIVEGGQVEQFCGPKQEEQP